MKLTDPENIQESEKEFIDTINAELDWEAIEKMLLEKHSFTLQEEIEYKEGDLVVHNEEIAYRFDFEIKVPLSVIFNREGECLEISTVRDDFEEDDEFDIPSELEETPADEDPMQDLTQEDLDLTQEDLDLTEEQDEMMDPVDLLDQELEDEEDQAGEQPPESEDKVAQMASNIADMISEINQGDE